jgi:hypothetical protein
MNLEPVVEALATTIVMLDTADADQVDPDFAVSVQEIVGDCLSRLSPADSAEVGQVLSGLADRTEDPATADYLRRFGAGLAAR